MNYVGFSEFDTANGPGIRVSLFVSGCRLHCKGCFNPESWDFNAGKPYTEEIESRILDVLGQPYISGLSILGGDPLEPENVPTVTALLERVRARYGRSKTVWLWTGRKYEKVSDMPLIGLIDVLVDGPFLECKKVRGEYFGSSNQRVIEIYR